MAWLGKVAMPIELFLACIQLPGF